ncbi:F0F1 ATP synthase subunit B [Candidatus Nomurabacteria bacterium]|nr:F0F1 ATP synthase subunit B [Candidatus Nomurabacteria bacterium]
MLGVFNILASTEESGGIAALGLDWKAVVIQGVTFLIFILIIKKFALAKIVNVLEDRRKTIESSIDKAEELTKQNEEAEKRVNELLHQARKEAELIIGKGHEEAGSIIKEAQDTASKKAEKIIADGLAQIDQQVLKVQDQLKKDTLELVAQATTALIGETVDVKKHESLIAKAITDHNNNKKDSK